MCIWEKKEERNNEHETPLDSSYRSTVATLIISKRITSARFLLLVSISYVHVRLRVMHPKRVDRSFEFLIMIVFNVIINYQ